MFSEQEVAYLKTQRLARISTAAADGQPDVAPVGFEFDGRYFYVGGLDLPRTLKYKNVQINPRVALVVDDVASTDPWMPRGVKLHGTADLVTRRGYVGSATYIRITPDRTWSWGIEEPALRDGKAVFRRATR